MQERPSTMTLIGLGLSGFTRRLSIPEVELPYSSTRRRQNASISSSSSSSHQQYPQAQHGIQSSTTSTSSFWTRPSLTPLLGHDSGEEEEGEARDWQHMEKYYSNESDYDGYLDTGKQYHRRRSSWSASSLSPSRSLANLSKQGLITLVYLVLFGIVLLTYLLQNGIQPPKKAYDTLAKLRYRIGVRDTQYPLQASQRIQREEKRIVWYADMKENTTMPKPFDGYRWTFLHANVMPARGFNETQERLEMLTFIESVPPKRQIGWWQLTLPPIPDIVSSATCHFPTSSGKDLSTPAKMEYDFKRAPFQESRARWALLISCDMPTSYFTSAVLPSPAKLQLLLADKKTTFTQSIKLKSKEVAKQAPSGSLGICLAPLYGRPNEKKMLEWRIHHAQLGVKVVHWYDRDQRGRTKEWVKELNRLLELEDTYTEAPCISPESCGKEEVLEDKGVSGDQVLYYADCLARSRHTHPTEWLAMIDFDEYLFPTSQNVTLSSFLSSQANTTAALAFERYVASSNPLLSSREDGHNNKVSTHPPNLILDKIQTLSTPSEIDRHDNTKMVYRSDALKLAWVHWEVAFRDDSPAQEKKVLKASIENGDGISLIHVSNFKGRGPFKMQFDVRSKMEDHVESVRDVYRAMVAKLPWLAS